MLFHSIQGAGGFVSVPTQLEFVGAATSSAAGLISQRTVSLTSLSGGIASSAAIGDIVILVGVVSNTSDLTFSASGYALIADLYANGTNDTNLGVFYKLLTAADTSATISWGTSSQGSAASVYVWRGVNTTTPFDVTRNTTQSATSGVPDCPAISTVSADTVVIALGACAGASANYSILTVPSGMENFSQVTGLSGTNPVSQIGIASIARPIAGSYNPPGFGGGFSTTSSSSARVTMALRKA